MLKKFEFPGAGQQRWPCWDLPAFPDFAEAKVLEWFPCARGGPCNREKDDRSIQSLTPGMFCLRERKPHDKSQQQQELRNHWEQQTGISGGPTVWLTWKTWSLSDERMSGGLHGSRPFLRSNFFPLLAPLMPGRAQKLPSKFSQGWEAEGQDGKEAPAGAEAI